MGADLSGGVCLGDCPAMIWRTFGMPEILPAGAAPRYDVMWSVKIRRATQGSINHGRGK